MKAPDIHDELACLGDTDRQAKKAFFRAYVETLGDELAAVKASGISPLDLQYFKANDPGFKPLMRSLKAQMSASQSRMESAVKQAGDTIRQTLKSAGLYTPLLEPQIDAYASIQYDLQALAVKRSSPFYDPLSGGSANPLERLIKERRAELQTVLKALGLVSNQKAQAGTGACKQAAQDAPSSSDPLAALKL